MTSWNTGLRLRRYEESRELTASVESEHEAGLLYPRTPDWNAMKKKGRGVGT